MLKLKFILSRATLAEFWSNLNYEQFLSYNPFFEIETKECHVLNKTVCDSRFLLSAISLVREDKRSCNNNTFSSQTAAWKQKHSGETALLCTFKTWKYNYERICVIVAPRFLRSDWLIRGESEKCGRYCGCRSWEI